MNWRWIKSGEQTKWKQQMKKKKMKCKDYKRLNGIQHNINLKTNTLTPSSNCRQRAWSVDIRHYWMLFCFFFALSHSLFVWVFFSVYFFVRNVFIASPHHHTHQQKNSLMYTQTHSMQSIARFTIGITLSEYIRIYSHTHTYIDWNTERILFSERVICIICILLWTCIETAWFDLVCFSVLLFFFLFLNRRPHS